MTNYQVPRGTQDLFGIEMKKRQKIEELARQFCYVFNYEEIRTPIFEHTEVFKRENDSSDVVNKEMYTFEDNGKRSLTLRPEGTAGVLRSFVENKMYAESDLPKKLFYIGPNFRYERPQKGRYRIHNQFGVELIGGKNPIIDAEIISFGYQFVSALGLKNLKVCINTLADTESRMNYREAMVEHFKDGIHTMCADCQRRFVQNPLRILDCKVDKEHALMQNVPELKDYLNEESQLYFDGVLNALTALEIPYEIDARLVRGFDYYTHTVFEVISVSEEMGSQSTIFGGGRYDGLVEYFGGPSISGMGFGMGLERLSLALDAENIEIVEESSIDLYVMSLDKSVTSVALELANMARFNGFVTEMDYDARSMKAQFKTVDRKMAKVVAILGEDEVKQQMVTLKNIMTKEQVSVGYDQMIQQLDLWLNTHQHDCSEECSCSK